MASTGSDSYRTDFKTFLGHDKVKRDFLLGFLVRQPDWKNIVDNLTIKDALSYSDVKRHLLSTASDASENALSTVQPPNNKKKPPTNKKKTSFSSPGPANQKECTWCKKHSPGRHLGHAWHECNKLKAHNESKEKGDPKPAKQEESHVTTLVQHQ